MVASSSENKIYHLATIFWSKVCATRNRTYDQQASRKTSTYSMTMRAIYIIRYSPCAQEPIWLRQSLIQPYFDLNVKDLFDAHLSKSLFIISHEYKLSNTFSNVLTLGLFAHRGSPWVTSSSVVTLWLLAHKGSPWVNFSNVLSLSYLIAWIDIRWLSQIWKWRTHHHHHQLERECPMIWKWRLPT